MIRMSVCPTGTPLEIQLPPNVITRFLSITCAGLDRLVSPELKTRELFVHFCPLIYLSLGATLAILRHLLRLFNAAIVLSPCLQPKVM